MIFVVVLIQKQLLLNIHIGYFSVVTPSLGCLTLRFFDGSHCDPHLKFILGVLVYLFVTQWLWKQRWRLHVACSGCFGNIWSFPSSPCLCVCKDISGWPPLHDVYCPVGVLAYIWSFPNLPCLCVCKNIVAGPLFVVCVWEGGKGVGFCDLFQIHPVYVCVSRQQWLAPSSWCVCGRGQGWRRGGWLLWSFSNSPCLCVCVSRQQWLGPSLWCVCGGGGENGGLDSVIFSKFTLFSVCVSRQQWLGPSLWCVWGGGGGENGGLDSVIFSKFTLFMCVCQDNSGWPPLRGVCVGGGGGGREKGVLASVIFFKFTLFMCVSRQQWLVPSSWCAPSSRCQSNPQLHSTTCQQRMDSWRPWPVQQTWTSWLRSKCCFDFRRRSQCRCNWTTVNLLAVSGLWHKLASCPVDLHRFSRGIP